VTGDARPWRIALALALGAAVPWLAESLQAGLASLRPELAHAAALPAWAAVIIAVALILAAVAPRRAPAMAGAAAIGGLSALGFVALVYRLPVAWVLALWPQWLAVGVALPVAVLTLASGGRRRRD